MSSFKIIATAKIVPGRVKRVRKVRNKVPDGSGALNRAMKRLESTDYDRDMSVNGKGVVTVCLSMPPQSFTDFHLFARKMRMNHSHLVRVALSEMMQRNGWKEHG